MPQPVIEVTPEQKSAYFAGVLAHFSLHVLGRGTVLAVVGRPV